MSERHDEVRCMLIPLHDGRLLLPNAAVAEVIGYREPDRFPGAEGWLQGLVNWHQRVLPVVDFERLVGRPERPGGIRQRIVVCYGGDAEREMPLLGIVAQGIPRLLQVSSDAVTEASRPLDGNSPIRLRVTIGGEELLVPDLDQVLARMPAGRARASA